MAYAPNYYNYQVAVIFAIMLGGMLLLAMVVGAIYFICVVNIRNKKGVGRTPSVADRGRAVVWQPAPAHTHMQQQPYSSVHNQQAYQQNANIGERYDDHQTAMPLPYTSGHNNQPHVQQYSGQESGRIRELQPEYAYQQGPTTWTTMTPVREEHIVQAGIPSTTSFHMSSV